MNNPERIKLINNYLYENLEPLELDITDESHLHKGHSGHGGAGHFKVRIVSEKFNDKSLIMRHRMVYSALDNLMKTQIHALSIDAIAKNEKKACNM